MSVINKQKFLAELAKLLTFMYEEDRQRALTIYDAMFEDAADEQLLLQSLNSPLRQAVEVARAYNAGKARLDAEDAPSDNDAFIDTIFRIREEAFLKQPVPEVPEEPASPVEEPAAEESAEEEPAEAPEAPAEDENQISLFDQSEEPGAEEPAPEEERPSAESEAEPVEETEAAAEAGPAAEAEAVPEEKPEEAEKEEPEEVPDKLFPAQESDRMPVQKTVRKLSIPLLLLYILIAVPLGLIGFVLLLIPALASLALAAACLSVAVMGISASLTSFPVISNLLVALGASLILLAVGLVFLMLFVWILGSVIGGMINGLISLGGRWCYREVPAK